jgi:hypothetical protein
VLPIEDVPSDIFLQLNADALLKTIDSIYVHPPTPAKILDVSYDQQVKTFESLDNVGPLRTHTQIETYIHDVHHRTTYQPQMLPERPPMSGPYVAPSPLESLLCLQNSVDDRN